MPNDTPLQQRFTEAMLNIYRRTFNETGYNASRFHQMITDQGGYNAAIALVHAQQPSEGYTALWKRRRLDLTVEVLILREEWNELFTDEDRRAARARLQQYKYDIDAEQV